MDIFCRKTVTGFIPLARDDFDQIRNGMEGVVTFKVPRNGRFHKKFMAMLRETLNRADVEMNFNQWRWTVVAESGHCEFIEADGNLIAVPKSISFDNMDETEAQQVYKDVLNHICDKYLHDDPEALDLWLSYS